MTEVGDRETESNLLGFGLFLDDSNHQDAYTF